MRTPPAYPAGGVRWGSAHLRTRVPTRGGEGNGGGRGERDTPEGLRRDFPQNLMWAPPASASASSEPRANATLFATFMAPPSQSDGQSIGVPGNAAVTPR